MIIIIFLFSIKDVYKLPLYRYYKIFIIQYLLFNIFKLKDYNFNDIIFFLFLIQNQ